MAALSQLVIRRLSTRYSQFLFYKAAILGCESGRFAACERAWRVNGAARRPLHRVRSKRL